MKKYVLLFRYSVLALIIGITFVTCAGNAQPAAESGSAQPQASTGTTEPAASSDGMSLDKAIAEAAVRIDERIPAGSKIAPLNFSSPHDKFSAYVLDELTANLVDSRKLTVVDRNEIDLIRSEFDFQYSGEVGDDSMQTVGQMLGAQSIISGSLTDMGGFYRIVIRVLNVKNASVEVQYRANIVSDPIVTALLSGGKLGGTVANSGRSTTASGRDNTTSSNSTVTASGSTAGITSGSSTGEQTAQTSGQTQKQQSGQAVIVEGKSLAEKLQWLEANAVNNTEYRVEVTANESLGAPVLSYPRRRNVTIRLISSGGERILSLTGNGSLFTIEFDVTFILDKGITLQGREKNNAPLIMIKNRGTLIMNAGAKILSNNNNDSLGGGVYVNENGTFAMEGGLISGNNSVYGGGGVFVNNNGTFTMTNGEISSNTTNSSGGGIYVNQNASYMMKGGEISGNKGGYGGGVSMEYGRFTMSGGEIYGNTANYSGGGVRITEGTFIMTGGEIIGNSTSGIGGGLCIDGYGTFTKTGGTICGSTGTNKDNRARNGQAVGGRYIRNSNAGPEVKLDLSKSGISGGWED